MDMNAQARRYFSPRICIDPIRSNQHAFMLLQLDPDPLDLAEIVAYSPSFAKLALRLLRERNLLPQTIEFLWISGSVNKEVKKEIEELHECGRILNSGAVWC